MAEKRKWLSTVGYCDLCNTDLNNEQVFYDCQIPTYGHWGLICHNCFKGHRCKTGTGAGQKYDTKTREKLEG